jgi:hypothetical protein
MWLEARQDPQVSCMKSDANGKKRRKGNEGTTREVVTRSLLGIVRSRLHLLRIVVRAVWPRCHHAADSRHSVAGLRVALNRGAVQLRRVHIECHAVLLVSDHIGRSDRSWRRNTNSGSCRRHDIPRLLWARYEHGHHTTGRHVWRLRTIGWVVIALRHVRLGRESGLVRLEGRSVDRSLGYIRKGCASGPLARIGGLADVLVKWWLLRRRGGAVDVGRNLLMERLLLLLLRWVEVHRGG